MELALHCQRARDRIDECLRTIDRHEDGEETMPATILEAFFRESGELQRALNARTVLWGLYVPPGWTDAMIAASAEAYFEERVGPHLVAGNTELAWAIVNCDKPLPLEFQKALFMDPTYRLLREDHELLRACVDKGLDGEHVKIVWSRDMAKNPQLVRKCFAMCPQSLRVSGGRNDDGGLPPRHLEDMANLRAFAFSDHAHARRCRATPPPRGAEGVRAMFAPALFHDPALLADLVLVATAHHDASKARAGREEDGHEGEGAAEEDSAAEYSTDEEEDAEDSTEADEDAADGTEDDDDSDYRVEEDEDSDDRVEDKHAADDITEEEGGTEEEEAAKNRTAQQGYADAVEDSPEKEGVAEAGTVYDDAAEGSTELEEDAADIEYEDAAQDVKEEKGLTEEDAAEDFTDVDDDADDRTDDDDEEEDRTEEEGWVRSVVEGAFPRRGKDDDDAATVLRQPLLDSEEFALRLARGLLDGAVPESKRHACPVTYRDLSPRLRAIPEVARAFVRLHPTNILFVPADLRGNDEIWGELWEAATTSSVGHGGDCDDKSSSNNDISRPGSGAHSTSSDAHSCSKRTATKLLVLQLLEESNAKYWPEGALNDFAEIFPSLDPEIQKDRDVNLRMAVACARAPVSELRDRLAPEWIHSREFWIDLAEKHHCPHDLWTLVPAPEAVATDAAVILAWARHAPAGLVGGSSGDRVRWIARAAATFPHLALLADRAVLLNWMPHFFRRFKMLFHDRIPPALLHDKSLWLELLPPLDDNTYAGRHIPNRLRHDLDIVQALLRCPDTKWKTFRRCYLELPEELQNRFAPRLVSAIESSDELHLLHKLSLFLSGASHLLKIPEVAHAAFSNGFNTESFDCEEAIQESDWSNDPDSMLSFARRVGPRSGGWYWICCSEELRENKAFLLAVLKLDDPPCLEVEGDLEDDYDILCATFAHRPSRRGDRVPTSRERDFIRTVRGRLQQYLSLEAFMAGIQSNESRRPHQDPAAPVALLRQDEDTLQDFKRRMVELLGCVSHEEASVLRRVSLTFTVHGF
jgi:hypothetical protein